MSLLKRIALLVSTLLCAHPVLAQERPLSSAAGLSMDGAQWEPLGTIPVDQAGAGRRGYVLPAETTEITQPGADQVSFHAVAANNFYREQTGAFLISQRYEAHTIALGYRRGFKVGSLPRFELGAQVQLTESDNGVLNGFIQRFESMWVSVTGRTSALNQLRTSTATLPPLGTLVTKNGRPLYRAAGDSSGFGDVYVVANALLRDVAPSSSGARVAARVAINLSGTSEFTQGNFAGAGISVDNKLTGWVAFHTDVRTNIFLNRASQWGLRLKRASFAFSAGPELRLARNSSISLQIDGSTTPYQSTGVVALDNDYGDITLGLSHRFTTGRRRLVTQFYARENMNLPFRVRWNTDPDLSVGIKATIR